MRHNLALAVALTAASLSAQNTFIVSATPGPDVDFADFPAAVAAALPGDRIELRPGTYTPASISVGVTIRGESGVSFSNGEILITNLPVGQTVVLRDLDLAGTVTATEPSRVRVANSAGPVHLENVDISIVGSGQFFLSMTCVTATGSPSAQISRVTLRDCTLRGGNCLSVGTNCHANLTNCDLTATTLPSIASAGSGSPAILGNLGSMVTVNGGTYIGGDSLDQGTATIPAAAGIQVSGQLRVGASGTQVIAGAPGAGTLGQPAIVSTAPAIPSIESIVVVDPSVILTPAQGQPATSSTVQVRRVPSVRPLPNPAPGLLSFGLEGPPGASFALVANPVFGPLPTEIGILWINPIAVQLLGAGQFDSQGTAAIWTPALPAGLPMVIGVQAVVFRADGAGLTLPTILHGTP